MKIAIYQIAIERDENRLAFQSLNHIISVSNGRVPVELYDCVFAGEVSAQTLEDIFYVFNMEHPSGYKGRSLSVVPFPVSWTVKMKKKQKETQDILSYHTQAAGCSDKARAKASGGRQPIEECGRTGL